MLFPKGDKNGIAFQAVLPMPQLAAPGEKVQYTQTMLNVGGGYDAKNARFIAPKSGVYSFGVNQLSGGGTSAVELAFFKNGYDYKIGCYDGENDHTNCVM